MLDARSRSWRALGAVSLSVLAVILDGTVLSVPLPTLTKALHASESDLEWALLRLPAGPAVVANRRRLDAVTVLVGLGVPDQRPGRLRRTQRDRLRGRSGVPETAGPFGTAITGTDVSLLVSAGIAVAGDILKLIFLPRAAAFRRSGLSMKEATRASEH
jgi:hypothetical protein